MCSFDQSKLHVHFFDKFLGFYDYVAPITYCGTMYLLRVRHMNGMYVDVDRFLYKDVHYRKTPNLSHTLTFGCITGQFFFQYIRVREKP